MQERAKYETSPERVAAIRGALDAVFDETDGRVADYFHDGESWRALAQRLRLPYLEVLASQFGLGDISEEDFEEYNAWRAAMRAWNRRKERP